jgi:tetratricopeptide (TPR) repeat protein
VPEIPRAARNDTVGVNDTIGVADEIARLCGCLPLALRAAASLIAATPDLNPLTYVTQLCDERTRLTKIGKEGVEIDVEASLNLSYRQLSPDAARIFRQLSVFPTSFDAAAAEAVCEDTDHAHLSQLVRLSLVQFNETTARYQLHDLTRLFADALLADDERAPAQLRHAEHYLSVLRQAKELYKQGNDAISQGLALFDLEWPNIQAGQEWAATHAQENTVATRLCDDYPNAGVYLLQLRLHPREQIRWMEQALTAARALTNRTREGIHLGNLGLAYADLGEARRAIESYEQILVIHREIGDRRGEGADLGNLGLAYADLGETRKAIEFYEQQLVIVRAIGDRRGESNALGNLGNAYADLGETRKAIEYHEQAWVIDREIGDWHGEGTDLSDLGNAYADLGETRKAIEFYEQALIIMREIGDRRGEGNALGNLGIAYKNLGEMHKAIEYYEQYLDIAREIGDRRGEGNALCNMSLALDKLGERAQAIVHAEAALNIYEAIEDPHAEMVRQRLAQWRGRS